MNVLDVQKDEFEIIEYGIYQMIWEGFNIATIFFIGILWGKIAEILVLFFHYKILRPFAGGYHSDTENRCYIFSVCMMNIDMFLATYFRWEYAPFFFISLICAFIVWILSPVENDRNPLTREERKKYRKQSRTVLIFSVGCLIGTSILNCMGAAWGITCSLIDTAILQIMGAVKYGRKRNEYGKIF